MSEHLERAQDEIGDDDWSRPTAAEATLDERLDAQWRQDRLVEPVEYPPANPEDPDDPFWF